MGKERKKKKRRKKRYLLKFTILVALFVGAYFFFTSEIFDIQRIQVDQNSYYTTEQVISIAGAKTGVSMFKVRTGKMKDKLLKDPYIQSAKVSRRLPNRLVITVGERKEFAAVAMENVPLTQLSPPAGAAAVATPAAVSGGGIPSPGAVQPVTDPGAQNAAPQAVPPASPAAAAAPPAEAPQTAAPPQTAEAPQTAAPPTGADGQPEAPAGNPSASAPQVSPPQTPETGTLYVLLDKDGLVLRKTDKAPTIPVIYGLTVKESQPGKPLKVEENLMFSDTMAMVKSMNDNDLFFKKILITPVVVKAYIYDNLICEGPPDVIEKSMKSLKDTLYVLYQQGIKRGVIHASGDDHMPFTFSPVIEQ